ncbi:MAG: hypothetical protein EOO07_33155, partial [Chitinophagaceae bacterium]
MKNLVLSVSSLLLLATQVSAQESQPVVAVGANNQVAKVSTSTSYAYTVNDVKNQVNVSYSSNGNAQDDGDSPVRSKTFSKSFS